MFAYTKGNLQKWRKLDISKQVLWQTVKTVCNVCLYKGQSSRMEKTSYILTGTLANSEVSLQCLLIQRAIYKNGEN